MNIKSAFSSSFWCFKQDLETVNQNNRFHEEMRIRAEPVRKYLLNSLMPHITEGLLLACKNRPEDAIDFMVHARNMTCAISCSCFYAMRCVDVVSLQYVYSDFWDMRMPMKNSESILASVFTFCNVPSSV